MRDGDSESGTGSAGMETCLVNLIEPGDRVLVGLNGVFGTRLAEVARRAGAGILLLAALACAPGREGDPLRVWMMGGEGEVRGVRGDYMLCDFDRTAAFLRDERPPTARTVVLARVSVHGRQVAVVGASRREREFGQAARRTLDRLCGVPITTWNYKSQDASIRHIGPMAQDFHAAFAVGEAWPSGKPSSWSGAKKLLVP